MVSSTTNVRANCDAALIEQALATLKGAKVASATINEVGYFDSAHGRIENLPAFCDIRILVPGDKHTTEIMVWTPLDWNGRFLATAGGGNRTNSEWVVDSTGIGVETYDMAATLPAAVRRQYATASTDGGNRDPRDFAWGIDQATGELDDELIENWHHRATKQMADVARAVITALYGCPPAFSYLVGTSGGGRQTIVTAQKYPGTFDGYWASCPAINWARREAAALWPAVVMNQIGTVLSPAKLDAFRLFALDALEGPSALEDGFLTTMSFPEVDARGAIGRSTEDGELTEADAEVMNLIWVGPRRSTGERLWYGIPVGAESWGRGLWGSGLALTEIRDGSVKPVPFPYARDWAGSWVLRDPDWNWEHLTFEGFVGIFDRSVAEFGNYDSSEIDFSGLQRSGGKLLLTHSNADGLIPPQGTVDFFQRVEAGFSDPGELDQFIRLFLSPGGGHSSTADGYGVDVSLDAGLAALVEWTEEGAAPDCLIARRTSPDTGKIVMQRPVFPYPTEARYVGGERTLPTSFDHPARVSEDAAG